MRGKFMKALTLAWILSGCGTTVVYVDDGCTEGEYLCSNDEYYICALSKSGHASWEYLVTCPYGCTEEGCILYPNTCHPEALDDFNQVTVNDRLEAYYNEDGTCKCDANCPDSCDESGACLCEFMCPYGCDEDGACAHNEICQYGWDDFGVCTCDESCPDSCMQNGDCVGDSPYFKVTPDPIVLKKDGKAEVVVRIVVNGEEQQGHNSVAYSMRSNDCVRYHEDENDAGHLTFISESPTACYSVLNIWDRTRKVDSRNVTVIFMPGDGEE